jgi:hypothetical protein
LEAKVMMSIILAGVLLWVLLVLPAIFGWFQSDDVLSYGVRKKYVAWALLLAATVIHGSNLWSDTREAKRNELIEQKTNQLSDWIVSELEKASQLEYSMRDVRGLSDQQVLDRFVSKIEEWRARVSRRLAEDLPKGGADQRLLAVAGEVGGGPAYYEYTRLTRLSDALGHVLDRPESYVARSLRRTGTKL